MKPAQDQLFRPCFSQSSSFGPNTLEVGFTALDNFQNFFYKLLWKHLGKYIFKSTVFQEFHSRAHKALESSLKGFEGEVMLVGYRSLFLLNAVKLLFLLGRVHS